MLRYIKLHCITHCNTIQYNTIQYTIHYEGFNSICLTELYYTLKALRYNTLQYNTIQYNTIHHTL